MNDREYMEKETFKKIFYYLVISSSFGKILDLWKRTVLQK